MTAAVRVRRVRDDGRKGRAGQTAAKALAKKAAAVLDDYKAVDVVVIPLAGQASFADQMVVATGTSTRHVASLGQALMEALGDDVLGAEGMRDGEWVCLDAGNVVVHVFVPEKRALYNLEKLWSPLFGPQDEDDQKL